MNSVTFLSSVGGDGSTVTDNADPETGLGNGGHRSRFIPALAQTVAIANNTVAKAIQAAASAAQALESENRASDNNIATESLLGAANIGMVGNISNPLCHLPLKNNLDFRGAGALTFTRNSLKTVRDSRGVLVTKAIDEPCFDKNGVTIHTPVTNDFTWSEQLDNVTGGWSELGVTVVLNATDAPDVLDTLISNTADKIVATSASALFWKSINKPIAFAIGDKKTSSVFVKAGEYSTIYFNTSNNVMDFQNTFTFNLLTKVFTSIGQGLAAYNDYGYEEYDNGWVRVWATITATKAATAIFTSIGINDGSGLAFTGDDVAGLYMWGSQINAGGIAPYVKSEASVTTTAPDILDLDALGNIGRGDRNLAIIVDYVLDNSISVTGYLPYAYDVAGPNITLRLLPNTDQVKMIIQGKEIVISTTGLSNRAGVTLDSAGDFKSYLNGIAKGSKNATITTPLSSLIKLGRGWNNTTTQINGSISNFKIYDRDLTNQEMTLG